MAVTFYAYGPAANNIRFIGDNPLKAMLVTSSYTPDTALHDFRSDITGEVNVSGYVAGGNTLANAVWTYDSTNKWSTLTASNLSWGALAVTTVRYVVVYSSIGSPTTDILLSYLDLGVDTDLTAQGLVVSWASTGLFRSQITV